MCKYKHSVIIIDKVLIYKKMENSPLNEYSFHNIGQARSIMKVLGYSESYDPKMDELVFTNDKETFVTSFKEIRKYIENIDDIAKIQSNSKEEVAKEFDKERATKDFDNYKSELEKQGIFIIKWDKDALNFGKNKNTYSTNNDGFTVIDINNKAAYTGKELYDYARDNGYFLDPIQQKLQSQNSYEIQQTKPEIKHIESDVLSTLEKVGVNKELIDKNTLDVLTKGEKSTVLDLNIQNENVRGRLGIDKDKNGQLQVNFYPELKEPPHILKFDDKEINLDNLFSSSEKETLLKGGIIVKEVAELNNKNVLFQFDKELNSYVAAKQSDIKIDIPLTHLAKEALMRGETIRFNTEQGDHLLKIDLLEKTGTKLKRVQDSQEPIYNNKQSQSTKVDENKQFKKDIARALIAGVLFGCPLVGMYFLLRNINKKDIDKYKLTSKDLIKLLDGKKTDIKRIDDKDVRLSLKENSDKSLSICLHDIQSKLGVAKFAPNELSTDNENLTLLKNIVNEKDSFKYIAEIFRGDDEKLNSFIQKNGLENIFNDGYKTFLEINSSGSTTLSKNNPNDLDKHNTNLDKLEVYFKDAISNKIADIENRQLGINISDIDKLNKGEIISKNINNEKIFLQADLKTNELVKVKESDMPTHIRDIELSSEQRENLHLGLPISLNINGESIIAKVDLNNKGFLEIEDDKKRLLELAFNGYKILDSMPQEQREAFIIKYDLKTEINQIQAKTLNRQEAIIHGQHNTVGNLNKDIDGLEQLLREKAMKNFDLKQKIDFDRFNPGVVSFLPTDENRAEYTALLRKNEASTIGNSIKI